MRMQERWLDLGLETLRESGTTGLRIDRLARQLGVTKGSFYAHFSSKSDYLTALCEHWRHQAIADGCGPLLRGTRHSSRVISSII